MKYFRKIKTKWILWFVLAVVFAVIFCVFFRSQNLSKIVTPYDDASIDRIVISKVVMQADPKTFTIDDSASCDSLDICLEEITVRRKGLNPSRVLQKGGIMYYIIIYYSDEELVNCTLFDGKIFCGKYTYTLLSDGENRLTQWVENAID